MPRTLVSALACALCTLASAPVFARDARAQDTLRYEIVATHPHDTGAFTQGLAYARGAIFESTGRYGQSGVWQKTPSSGATRRHKALATALFGEGLALNATQVVQLTWQEGRALVYDATLRAKGEFRYDGEGWGLAWDGTRWLMSDGSADIVARAPADFAETGRITVRDGDVPVSLLNELEYARGWLYANVWHSDRIAVIEPATGVVQAWLDLSALKRGFAKPAGWDEREHVLNGIAWNPDRGTFYVTGKCWPVLYEIRLPEMPAAPAR